MDKNVLFGSGRDLISLPPHVWRRHVGGPSPLGFMTPDHHRVRNFAVLQLPRLGRPLPPGEIAEALRLPLEKVTHLLESLEHHKTFIWRNPEGAVAWAYPVTVEPTPHRLTFSTGEQIYAA